MTTWEIYFVLFYLFRNRLSKNLIKNSIIMNGAYIGDNVYIENCIVESSETLLSGSKYIGENEIKIVSEKKKRYEVHQINGEG